MPMRLALPHAGLRVPGQGPGQDALVAAGSAWAGRGVKVAVWSVIHLVGAAVFLIAMIARMAQAEPPLLRDTPDATVGSALFLNMERPLPSPPNLN